MVEAVIRLAALLLDVGKAAIVVLVAGRKEVDVEASVVVVLFVAAL